MKNEIYYIVLISLALMLSVSTLGCGGKDGSSNTSGVGYTVSVKPTNVIAGGTFLVDVRISNIYDKDMTNLASQIINIPSGYPGADNDPVKGISIAKGQTIPAIWTISAPDTGLRETVSPLVKVCFDYKTEYQFQSAFRQSTALGDVTLSSSVSRGPVSVTAIGADSIYISKTLLQPRTVTLDIKNAGTGSIESIDAVGFVVPNASSIVKTGSIGYASCKNEVSGGATALINKTATGCSNLGNKNVVSNGVTLTLGLNTQDSTDAASKSPVIDKLAGYVTYRYCYELPVGTITVCPAGQVC